jgi:hypothetical protein
MVDQTVVALEPNHGVAEASRFRSSWCLMPQMASSGTPSHRTWLSLYIALVMAPTAVHASGLNSQPAVEAERAVLARQRTYDTARSRREPVDQLVADDFVEIAPDGRVLTRTMAIENYGRFDDVSAGSITERHTALHGDVAIIMGRTGEEGTPYSARRLYVWVREGGSWRLKVLQKTFMRSRTAKLSPLGSEWPAEFANELPTLAEETLATGDSSSLSPLLVEHSLLVDAYGEQLSGRPWLARSTGLDALRGKARNFRYLHHGDTTVVIGDEVAPQTGMVIRFTRVWKRSTQGEELVVGQWTPAAAEVSGRER